MIEIKIELIKIAKWHTYEAHIAKCKKMAANFTLFVTEDEESRVVHVHGSEASDAKIRVGEIYLKTIFTTVVFPHV